MSSKEKMRGKLILLFLGVLLIVGIGIWEVGRTSTSEGNKCITWGEAERLLQFSDEVMQKVKDIPHQKEKCVTYKQMEQLLRNISITYDEEKKTQESRGVRVPWEDWWKIYDKIIETHDSGHTIVTESLLILGTNRNIEGMKDNEVMTNKGIYTFKEIKFTDFMNQVVSVVIQNGEILAVRQKLSDEIAIKNTFIIEGKENSLKIFLNGFTVIFQNSNISTPIENTLADIIFQDGQVIGIHLKEEKIQGEILAASEDGVEIDQYGYIPFDEQYRIFRMYGEIAQLDNKALIVGDKNTEFIVAEGKVCSAFVNHSPSMERIRVLLKTNEFKNIFHGSVTFTGTTDFTVLYGNETEEHKAGEEITITPDSAYLSAERLQVKSSGTDGKIQVLSIKRSEGCPAYRGNLEIVKNSQGIVLINDVLMEEYLYAVVPSEMPTNYNIEALKAQAVCARSYAEKQFSRNVYSNYGAHVDDSVKFQTYNNIAEDQKSVQAVDETNGVILTDGNEVIEAYYFSTSCGFTTDGKIWDSNAVETKPYLVSKSVSSDSKEKVASDMSNEDEFREFILNKNETDYEKDFLLYRWSTTLQINDIKNSLDSKISSRYEANSDNVLTQNADGQFESKPVRTLGNIKKISVAKRNAGGVVHELLIEGSEATVKIISEYNIRELLSVSKNDINCNNGKTIQMGSMLPSGYFVIDENYDGDEVSSITLSGGGNGHGAGMSQYGAIAMAEAGMNYEDILNFYYSGIELKNLYTGD